MDNMTPGNDGAFPGVTIRTDKIARVPKVDPNVMYDATHSKEPDNNPGA